jgi:hypothetical protein
MNTRPGKGEEERRGRAIDIYFSEARIFGDHKIRFNHSTARAIRRVLVSSGGQLVAHAHDETLRIPAIRKMRLAPLKKVRYQNRSGQKNN